MSMTRGHDTTYRRRRRARSKFLVSHAASVAVASYASVWECALQLTVHDCAMDARSASEGRCVGP